MGTSNSVTPTAAATPTSSSSSSSSSNGMGFLPSGMVVKPKWPKSVKKRLEDITIERVHEADVTPAVSTADSALWNHCIRMLECDCDMQWQQQQGW
jgi:hypothetical protein